MTRKTILKLVIGWSIIILVGLSVLSIMFMLDPKGAALSVSCAALVAFAVWLIVTAQDRH